MPASAKLPLLASAIVDDIGGILVIAAFLTEDLSFRYLAVALITLVVIWFATEVGIRSETLIFPRVRSLVRLPRVTAELAPVHV